MAEVHIRTLKRAAEIAGGEQQLALKLKVTPSHLALWLQGIETPPGDVFLRAVDLVTDHELSRLSGRAGEPGVPPSRGPGLEVVPDPSGMHPRRRGT